MAEEIKTKKEIKKSKKIGGTDPSRMIEKKLKKPDPDPYIRSQKEKLPTLQIVTEKIKFPEGAKDAANIERKPHSSPEGRFESRLRNPIIVEMRRGGKVKKKDSHAGKYARPKRNYDKIIKDGKIRIAKRGGGRAYGQNS